jgi:hypothetical protein
MNEPTLKLPRVADELLEDFPMVEPDFEAQAKAIEARLKGDAKDPGALLPMSAGISDDDLFKAPTLTAEAGEPGTAASAASSVRAAEPPKSNFAEMARKSVQKKDDDAAQIAKELLAATAQSRRPSAEMVERVRAAGRVSATASPLPTGEAADDVQRTSGVVARAPESAPQAQPAGSNRGTVIGILGGALALAACIALYIQSNKAAEPSAVEAAVAAEKAAAHARPAPQAAPPTEAAKPVEAVLSPDALAAAPTADAPGAASKAAPKAGVGAAIAAAPAKGAPAASGAAKPEAVVLEDDPEPAKPAAPEPKPEAAPEPPLKPAEGNTGGVPLTPSAGAISSALSGVRASAQACLAGQSTPVSASVTFAADGHVLRVGAAGPAASCIQAALSKARIQPFAKESFTANTTIRPP